MKNVLLSIVLFLLAFTSQAQSSIVSGNVSDSLGPLPGVNIVIKGTSKGTQTDFDGNYTLSASINDTLIYTYVGFKPVNHVITHLQTY